MADRSDGCSGEALLALCARTKMKRKMTKDYYWIGAEENIGMFSILASVSFWPLLIIELMQRSVPARLIIR